MTHNREYLNFKGFSKNPDTVKLLIRLQRQLLRRVAQSRGDPGFEGLLSKLEDENVPEEERISAEVLVKQAVLDFGVWIGHGDLLTVKMILEARACMSGSATAFGRLEFLGPVRLQLLHMKMKKVTQDYEQVMPKEVNFEDELTVPWIAGLSRIKVSNKVKDWQFKYLFFEFGHP